jgi:hypothetical protein
MAIICLAVHIQSLMGLQTRPNMVKVQDLKQSLLGFPMLVTTLLSTQIWRFNLACNYKDKTGISWEILAKTNDIRYLDQIKPASHLRPGFEPGSHHVGSLVDKVACSPSTSVSPANSHSTDCSTIIYHLGLVQ